VAVESHISAAPATAAKAAAANTSNMARFTVVLGLRLAAPLRGGWTPWQLR
jgi:hypothetical protein